MEAMEVLLVYYVPGVGHSLEITDATPVLVDGADEDAAIQWAAEKNANGREVVGVDFGTHTYLLGRIDLVYSYVEIREGV